MTGVMLTKWLSILIRPMQCWSQTTNVATNVLLKTLTLGGHTLQDLVVKSDQILNRNDHENKCYKTVSM